MDYWSIMDYGQYYFNGYAPPGYTAYERSFMQQCRIYRNRRISVRFRLFVRVFHSSVRFDLDNSLKTLLDC